MTRFPPPNSSNMNNFPPSFPPFNDQFGHPSQRFPGPQFRPQGPRFSGRFGPRPRHGMPQEFSGHRGPRPFHRGPAGVDNCGGSILHGADFHGHFSAQDHWRHPGPPHQRFERPMHNQNFQRRSKDQNRHGNANGGANQPPQGNKQKKKKKGKAPEEINYALYCDVCDRGFKSDEQLQSHISEHVKCQEKDCRFVAHAKVVKLHHKLQHGPGAKKIRWLDTPEEIQKWRNERKRNYPTAANVARKKQKVEERKSHGIELETKQFGKMKRSRGCHQQDQAHHSHRVSNEKPSISAGQHTVPTKKSRTDQTGDGVPHQSKHTNHSSLQGTNGREAGSRNLGSISTALDPGCDPLSFLTAVDDGLGDEEGEIGRRRSPEVEVAPKGSLGSLGSLAACYDSDSEEEDDEEEEDAGSKADNANRHTQRHHETAADSDTALPRNPDDPAEGPDESFAAADCEEREGGGQTLRGHGGRGRKRLSRQEYRQQRKNGRGKGKAAPSQNISAAKNQKGTLLEMLLAPEIRKERNIILQCVRHVVKSKFFQDGTSIVP